MVDVFSRTLFIGEHLNLGSSRRFAIMARFFLFALLIVPFAAAVYIKTGWVDYYQDYSATDYKVVCYYDSFAHYRDGK